MKKPICKLTVVEVAQEVEHKERLNQLAESEICNAYSMESVRNFKYGQHIFISNPNNNFDSE